MFGLISLDNTEILNQNILKHKLFFKYDIEWYQYKHKSGLILLDDTEVLNKIYIFNKGDTF